MAKRKNTEVFIPGKAYEVIMKADFMTAKKIPDEPTRLARIALKEGERRNKGRGYRVLVTLSPKAAAFLCGWFSDYRNSTEYGKLKTADALAVRTICERLCEIASVSPEEKAKRDAANERRLAAMKAGRDRANAVKAEEATRKITGYREWVKLDAAYWDAVRRERDGDPTVVVPPKPILNKEDIPSDAEYVLARDRSLIA